MKVPRKPLVAMLGLAAMAVSLGAPMVLAAGPETADRSGLPKYKFAVITHSTAVRFFVPVRKGAEDAGQVLGAEVTYTGPPDFNIQKQIDFIKSAIAQNVDGIATTMPDPTAFNDVVKEAMDRGIPVIAVNADAPASGRLAYVGQNSYEAGVSMGEEIFKVLRGGHVLLCLRAAGMANMEARIKGVEETLDRRGQYSYRVVVTGTDKVQAVSLITSAFHEDPSIKGMFGIEEIAGSAIVQIIRRDHLKGKVAAGSFDLVADILDAIENGELQFTVAQQPYLQGYLSVTNLYLFKRYNLAPSDINTNTVSVTWENVATVKEQVAQGYR
jgi:simple sugar transport system substrate-binding protein